MQAYAALLLPNKPQSTSLGLILGYRTAKVAVYAGRVTTHGAHYRPQADPMKEGGPAAILPPARALHLGGGPAAPSQHRQLTEQRRLTSRWQSPVKCRW
jgi:hypothetical protein